MEELELIWPWLAGRIKHNCFKLAKIIVKILDLIAIGLDECYFLWIFCGNCWHIPRRVADLTKREVAFELQIDVLERRLAIVKEGENNYRRKFVRLLGMRMDCINVHHGFNDQDQILGRIRELERQRDDRQVEYHELLAKYTTQRQASSALILAGGPARTVEKLLDESLHTKDLHRQQIQTLTASVVESGAEIAILKDKVKTLERDLETVNEGKATLLWRDMEKQNIELRKRAEEEIWERDVKIQRLRDYRDDNSVTSLSLDSKGQQILRRLREELMKAEDKLAHSEMIIAKLKNNEARIDEIRKQIKREALYGASERMGELYMNAAIQVDELSEKLKRFEHLTDPEHDIEAVQRNCNEEKGKLRHEIADKTSQISTFKAQIDHAMGCLDWTHNKFEPLDKYLGFVPGAKEQIRRLVIELRRFHFLSEVHQGPETTEHLRVLEDLARERDRVSDQRQDLRVMCDELLHERLRNETELEVLRDREARRNTQVTNLQKRNRELQVQLMEAQAAVPPADPPDITEITAPIAEIFRTNLLALEMEIRRRGIEIQDAVGIPGVDGLPRVEREPGEISMLRIFEGHRERFDELSGLVRASRPIWLGAADDWVDDDSNNSPENLEARSLNRILRIQDLWDYIGTLHYDTILFLREFCTRRIGIVPGVEAPEPPQPPPPVPSPTPPPRTLPPPALPPRDRDLFPAQFTRYKLFDIQRWNVFPLFYEEVDSSLSVLDALQGSIQAQLPNYYAEKIFPGAFLAETLYRLNHSFVLKTVTQFPLQNGGFRYLSREIMYPDTLDVPPPRQIVVLYLSGNLWQGMSLKQGAQSPPESEEGSDGESGEESPLPDLVLPKLVEFNIAEWKLGHLRESWMRPGHVTMRENLSPICAVALSFHLQYPGILPRHLNGAEAYENMYERFMRVLPHANRDYSPLHIQVVLEDIPGNQHNRPHYRLAVVKCYELAVGDVRYFSRNLGGDSQSPVLYVFSEPDGKLHAMRRRRDGDSEDMLADLDWIQDFQQPSPDLPQAHTPAHTPAQPVDVVPPADSVPAFMRRDEDYGRNVIRAPFHRDGWYFDVNISHLNEGLTKRHMNWIHNCGPQALYYSMENQVNLGNLFWGEFFQIFEEAFPRHYNAWEGEELARLLKWHPRLGGFTLGIVHGVVLIVYVASITDVRFQPVAGRPDHRNHWVGMSYPAGEAAPPPPPLHTTRPTVPPPAPPRSVFRPLLDAQASDWSDMGTTTSASRPPVATHAVQSATWQGVNAAAAAFQLVQPAAANTQQAQQQVGTAMQPQQQPGLNPAAAMFQQGQPAAANAQQPQQQLNQAGFGTNAITINDQLEIARQLREEQGRGGNEEEEVRSRGS
ncbi:9643b8ea-cb15-4274-b211-0221ed271225-CDS [Sclerotinia trifoliorum]|uniref:9643b8ea-cb15-4274-b211-0221ed271225-CDS n=1 Tax=Sclerotinia trifoliorum TaxID=28548 RepID=A0A8H2ZUN0_9HELO|nr:9643b8ea-cb15-4274-b211-0221ed271225-CDS [Sclerotinia trifoliorum]